MTSTKHALRVGAVLLALSPTLAAAQTENETGSEARDYGAGDIIVTAQKRSESINSVPISITAASGEQLTEQGVMDTASLVKVVPGLQYTPSLFATPVFSLRGVGFYDASFAATSAVAVYVDEVSLPFTVMTGGALLDLERVEVLKGPQGTLFGQNATGGTINFVAAKPTAALEAGMNAGITHFGRVDLSGFVSGPVTDRLRARVAVSTTQFGAWQKSYTREDRRGDQNRLNGRALLDWEPVDRVALTLSATGWRDDSEVPAAQFLASLPNLPPAAIPAIVNYPRPPRDNRFADWTPGTDNRRHARFYQLSARLTVDVTDQISLISISSLSRFRERRSIDIDGTTVDNIQINSQARIRDFSQELRLQGDMGALKWIVGVNYQKSSIHEFNTTPFNEASVNAAFLFATPIPFRGSSYFSDQDYKTKAAFTNVDIELSELVTLHGGIRYSDQKAGSIACSLDDPFNVLSTGYSAIYGQTFAPGQCVNHAIAMLPGGGFTIMPGLAFNTLDEDNVAWRAGVDFKPGPGKLLYLSVSKGYKSGSFPTLNGANHDQFKAAKQESLLSYEAGFKLGLADRRLQLNGAIFYYDYSDKQTRGRILNNPNIFGPVETLLNIPKSRVAGAELQLTVIPVDGLTLSSGVVYLDTKLRGNYSNYNILGEITAFDGESFPLTPKWQAIGDIEYGFGVGSGLDAFAGVAGRYQSATKSAFGDPAFMTIKDYGALDLRAGLQNEDAGWRLAIFARNLTDTYYWTNATRLIDTAIRFAGEPRTFGLSFTLRTN